MSLSEHPSVVFFSFPFLNKYIITFFNDPVHVVRRREGSINPHFPLGRPMWPQLLHFQLKCFSELCSKGHPVVSYPDIWPAQIRKSGSRLFPPSTSALHSLWPDWHILWRDYHNTGGPAYVWRDTAWRDGLWKIYGFMFLSCFDDGQELNINTAYLSIGGIKMNGVCSCCAAGQQ